MPVTVIVGGQFGSEGKGKVSKLLTTKLGDATCVRIGGTNSGHRVKCGDNYVILRQLPTPAILPDIICVLGAGSYINPDILFDEISRTGLSHGRLIIDPNAMIISDKEQQEEENSSLRKDIGSTLSGTGAAVRRRIARESTMILAKDEKRLQQFVRPAVPFLRDKLSTGERIIIEGTQGFGLSLLHSSYYPFVTSRDTTAAAFISEAGLSPLDVDDVVLVIRAFPIRVGGNSGPLPKETSWGVLTTESGSGCNLVEFTSVTKRLRRVAKFDSDIVRQAIACNK